MIDNTELHNVIEELCEEYSLYLQNYSEEEYRIYTDYSSGITLFLKFEDNSKLSFYFLQRTPDVVYPGDRSDTHVVLSLMFSCFLRIFDLGISCSLLDIPHPIILDEIWGRYIVPIQSPILHGINSSDKLIEVVRKIISTTTIWREILWQNLECPCDNCFKEENIENKRGYEIPCDLEMVIASIPSTEHYNFGSRIRPNWDCYYDMDNEVTIIRSSSLSQYLRFILQFRTSNTKHIEGINGKLILDDKINNFIDNLIFKEFNGILKSLIKNETKLSYPLIPLENMVITVVEDYIIALGRLTGENEFKKEKELIRKRHNKESQLLFPISEFEWLNPVCPEQFENLIKALLEREPKVRSVRKPAPLNQGDKGRDLIIEWNVIRSYVDSEETPPTSLIKFVGQCKTSKKTIGKNKVQDIRDTIDTHNSKGYFLAVNNQISAPLTEKLEELKSRGYSVEWWNQEDIELRLRKNPDLIPLFSKVIIAKNKVKFIEE